MRASSVVAAVPLVLVPALGAVQGGFLPGAWVWATPLAAWGAALGAVLWGAGSLRSAWPWAAATAALLAWTAASWLWSVNRTQTVLEIRRTALYAAAVLALLALARRRAGSALVLGTYVAVAGLVLYALLRYLLGTRPYNPFQGTLLAQPLGYANAIGILAALGLLLGAGVAAHARARAARLAAIATLPPLVLALSLAASRGSWLALVAGAGVAVFLGDGAAVLRAALVAAPGAALLVALGWHLGLANAHQATTRADGLLLAAATLAVAAATAVAGARAAGWRPPGIRRLALPALLMALVVAGAGYERVATTNPRASYWHVAWHAQVTAHPGLGTGAGTFGHYWMGSRLAPARGGALDAHSLYLETLAELGPVGLALVLAALLLPFRGLCNRGTFTPAAGAAWAAFLVHAGLDWDWELPAVVIAALACAAAVQLGDGEEPRPLPPRARAAAVAAALLLGATGLAGATSAARPAATVSACGDARRASPHASSPRA